MHARSRPLGCNLEAAPSSCMYGSDYFVLSRCIQRADQPIILTGYAALNKLLGREVYTSHMQLGGPKVCSEIHAMGLLH